MRTRVSNTRWEKGDNLILEFMFHQKQSTVLSVKSQFVRKITPLPSFNSVPLEISIIIIMNMGCNKTMNPTNPPHREINNTSRPSYSNENFVFNRVAFKIQRWRKMGWLLCTDIIVEFLWLGNTFSCC